MSRLQLYTDGDKCRNVISCRYSAACRRFKAKVKITLENIFAASHILTGTFLSSITQFVGKFLPVSILHNVAVTLSITDLNSVMKQIPRKYEIPFAVIKYQHIHRHFLIGHVEVI
jgi:hypothetical protein